MRRLALPLFLVVIALVAAVLARNADADAKPVELSIAEPAPSPATPVLSARRAPSLVAVPAAEQALSQQLTTFVETVPGESCLVVTHDERTVFEYRPALPLVGASTQKLVTGMVALDRLGADMKFRTEVLATESADDGIVEGDLWIVGGGDPIIATDDYVGAYMEPPISTDIEALADQIAASGLTTVTGGVNADETRYDAERYLSVWPDRFIEQNQTGPLGALTINDAFSSYPAENFIRGEAIAADDPAVEAAADFDDLLEARGVSIGGGQSNQPAPDGLTSLGAIESPPLADIVADMISASDNATAELLLKEIGRTADGQPVGSTNGGVTVAQQVVSSSGLPSDGVVITDGSGLSPENRVTCAFLVGLLEREGTDSDLTAGLPVAGESGTLRDRFVGTPIEGRLRAKTGTLNDVTALAGFVDTESGDQLTFAFIVNKPDLNLEALALQNTLIETLSAYPSGVDMQAIGPL